jgi:hypothetical protein
MKSVGSAVVREAKAVIEPFDGRYMISTGNRIIQLSFFPGASITAWSETELPFTVEQMVRVGRSIMARAGNTIYVYGGLDGDTYPGATEYVVEAVTPFLSSQDPANQKQQDGFDMAGEGDWEVYLLVDPNNLDAKVRIGVVNKITYPQGSIKAVGLTSHTAVQFISKSAGRCTLSSFALHYEKGETE